MDEPVLFLVATKIVPEVFFFKVKSSIKSESYWLLEGSDDEISIPYQYLLINHDLSVLLLIAPTTSQFAS